MRRFPVLLDLFVAATLCCFFLNCTETPTEPSTPPAGSTQNGFFGVTSPVPGTIIRWDSTITITWVTGNPSADPIARIDLFQGDVFIRTITSSASSNYGTVNWNNYTSIPTGDNYRIRIVSIMDTNRYDFGGYFSFRSRYYGAIAVTEPTVATSAHRDSGMVVRWTATDSIGPTVTIQLYSDTVYVTTVYSSISASLGSYTWYPMSSALSSGTKYRIRVSSSYDPGIYDFSEYFAIRTGYTGAITVTAPQDTTVARHSTYSYITWTTTGNIGASVKIQLYSDSTLVSTLSSNTSSSAGSYSWYPSIAIVPGNRYRIKISAYYDLTIYAWSSYFSVRSQYYGTFAVTNPVTSSIFAAGSAYPVQWLFSGSPGSYINLLLYKDSIFVSTIATMVSNTSPGGTFPWTVSTGLVSSNRYQVKVVSYYDTTLYAYSSRFSISGIVTDTFETDDSVRLAKPIPTDSTAQWHNLTVNDADWMTFNATTPRLYVINAACSTNVTVNLYADGSPTASIGNAVGTLASNARIVWFCAAAGKYNLLVRPQTASNTGSYRISVKEYDSTAFRFRVTRPVTDTAFVRGSICPVAWSSAVNAGGNVDIFLFDAASAVPVRTIATNVANSGSYSGVIDAGVPEGTAYYIKVVSLVNSAINGSSGTFKITQQTN